MERMKTFLIYVLLIIGFFILSMFLENGLLKAMYRTISGNFDGYYDVTNSSFKMNNISAKASNYNGYIDFDLINSTGYFVEKCYLKLDLYNEQNLKADTEYIEIRQMEKNASRSFKVKFKAQHINKYNFSILSENDLPDTNNNIIHILGWDIDLSNLFGLGIDISGVEIFGIPIKDFFNWDNLKGIFSWDNIKNNGKSIFANINWGQTFFVFWLVVFPYVI